MHTKGPWEVFEGPEDRPELTVIYEDKTGQLVQIADCLSGDVPPKERKGNARLSLDIERDWTWEDEFEWIENDYDTWEDEGLVISGGPHQSVQD